MNQYEAKERLWRESGDRNFRDWYRNTYLYSNHWKELRASVLTPEKLCEVCKRRPAGDVHHLRYKSIYDVKPKDLKAVCHPCHEQLHKITPPTLVKRKKIKSRALIEPNSSQPRRKLTKSERKKLRRKEMAKKPKKLTMLQQQRYEQLMDRGRL